MKHIKTLFVNPTGIDFMDSIYKLELSLFIAILVLNGMLVIITTPKDKPKGMSLTECLEAVGDYKLCERKLTNGK